LLSELRIHDEDEREMKSYKTKNLDKDGEMESLVRKKLLGNNDLNNFLYFNYLWYCMNKNLVLQTHTYLLKLMYKYKYL